MIPSSWFKLSIHIVAADNDVNIVCSKRVTHGHTKDTSK
jgi:hypothetical protein